MGRPPLNTPMPDVHAGGLHELM